MKKLYNLGAWCDYGHWRIKSADWPQYNTRPRSTIKDFCSGDLLPTLYFVQDVGIIHYCYCFYFILGCLENPTLTALQSHLHFRSQ